MSAGEIAISVMMGLAVNEVCDLSPWLARRLIKRAAQLRYGTDARADVRAEEWSDLVDLRPGKLFKLLMALSFVSAALPAAAGRAVRNAVGTVIGMASVYGVLRGGLAYLSAGGDSGRVAEAISTMSRPFSRMAAWRRLAGPRTTENELRAKIAAYNRALQASLPDLPPGPGSFYMSAAHGKAGCRRFTLKAQALLDLLIIFTELGEAFSGIRELPSKKMVKAWVRMAKRDSSAFPI